MNLRIVALALLTALLGAFVVVPVSVSALPGSGAGVPEGGDVIDGDGTIVGTIDGTISNLVFTADRATDQVLVSGDIAGTFSPIDGDPIAFSDTFEKIVVVPTGGQAACDILFLDLGPLFLDVLGLTVDLSEIVLDVNAVPGAGKLLGNLQCALTGLLDGPGSLQRLIGLLNRIADLLG